MFSNVVQKHKNSFKINAVVMTLDLQKYNHLF